MRQDFQRSHDSMQLKFRQQQETLERFQKLLEKLQRQDERSQSKEILIARAAGKPAALKELCDIIRVPKESNTHAFPLDQTTLRSQSMAVAPLQNPRSTPATDSVCICHRPHRLMAKMGIELGHIYLSSDWETQGHWPSCPFSKAERKSRRALSLKYNGLARMLNWVINVSFAWTSGAGGFSISPNFTYHTTVDIDSAPAFRIIGLIRRCFGQYQTGNREHFMVACLRKLVRLFDEKKACPSAVSVGNKSLMHYTAEAVRS